MVQRDETPALDRSHRRAASPFILAFAVLALAAGVSGRAAAEEREGPYGRVAAGDSLFARGEIAGAEAEYEAALDIAKSFQAGTAPREEGLCLANYGLARVALTRGRTEEAEKRLKSCRDKPKFEGIYMLGMGLTRYHQGKLDQAETTLLQGASRLDLARGDGPPSAVRLEMADSLISIAISRELPLIAVERLTERAKLVPGDPRPHIRKGRLLAASREYEDAVAAFDKAISVDSTAVAAYQEIAAIYSRAQGGKPVAAKALERLAGVLPTLEHLMAAGQAWEEAGQPQKAAEMWERALKLAPDDPRAKVGLARAFYGGGDRARAIEIFLSVDPGLLGADDWEGVGRALLDEKEYPEARAAFLRAVALDSTKTDALFFAGYTHYVSREYAQAIPYFERRVKMDSTSTAAFSNLGLCYLQVGRSAEGIEQLNTAVRLAPDDVRSRIWLAQAYAIQSRWEAAAGEYKRALEMDGQNAEAWRGLGFVQLNQGRYGEAIDSLTKADRLDPNNVQGLIWLAQGHGMAEHYETAASFFRKALSVDPGSQEAREGLKEIENVIAKQKRRRPSAS